MKAIFPLAAGAALLLALSLRTKPSQAQELLVAGSTYRVSKAGTRTTVTALSNGQPLVSVVYDDLQGPVDVQVHAEGDITAVYTKLVADVAANWNTFGVPVMAPRGAVSGVGAWPGAPTPFGAAYVSGARKTVYDVLNETPLPSYLIVPGA